MRIIYNQDILKKKFPQPKLKENHQGASIFVYSLRIIYNQDILKKKFPQPKYEIQL
ncbi:hypothetical protein PL10110_480027 [Planktothrix agardhii]|nr:hypothetical protein PL10110_480027 [Planktothrix agardhii]